VVEFDDTAKVDNFTIMFRDERVVVAFHGTSDDRAAEIIASGSFIPSKNDYDWLGHGVYFWEYAPLRAWQWARQKHREHAAVVEAQIALGFCLDLSDIRYTAALRLAYDSLREAFIRIGRPLPVNRNKARLLDCLVINYLATYILPECSTVRGPFLEGDPVYDGSMLLTQSHVQLVVRHQHCIVSGPKLLKPEVV
jgi:hypothetical protein